MNRNLKNHRPDLRFWFDNLWRWKLNLPEIVPKEWNSLPPLESMWKSEWSPYFEELCKKVYKGRWNKKFVKKLKEHLIIGAVRYGFLHAVNKPIYDRVDSMIKRIRLYKKNGNLEYLVDCANLCLLEFEEGIHPKRNMKELYTINLNLTCIEIYLKMYKKTGSLYYLIFAFCKCMYEYTHCKHPNKHYRPIEDGSATRVKGRKKI